MPNVIIDTIDCLLDNEKRRIQGQTTQQIEYHILKKSPTEVTYHYSFPHEPHQRNAVFRSFLPVQGYCSSTYTHFLPTTLPKKEISQWKKRLAKIKLCDSALQ